MSHPFSRFGVTNSEKHGRESFSAISLLFRVVGKTESQTEATRPFMAETRASKNACELLSFPSNKAVREYIERCKKSRSPRKSDPHQEIVEMEKNRMKIQRKGKRETSSLVGEAPCLGGYHWVLYCMASIAPYLFCRFSHFFKAKDPRLVFEVWTKSRHDNQLCHVRKSPKYEISSF